MPQTATDNPPVRSIAYERSGGPDNRTVHGLSPIDSTLRPSKQRDLRLDLFRGLANWAIFLDHIPDNVVAWLTTRNYGFSDAADLFVFVSGYTAALAYVSA